MTVTGMIYERVNDYNDPASRRCLRRFNDFFEHDRLIHGGILRGI